MPKAATSDTDIPAANAEKTGGTVTSGLHILRLLSRAGRPMRASHIGRELAINQSTCFNILRTLVADDILAFDPAAKTYSLAASALSLAPKSRIREADVMVLKPAMERLATGERVLVTLWRRDGDRMVLLLAAEPDLPLGIGSPLGCRVPAHIGAAGRVFAARSGAALADLKRDFQNLRWHKPPTFQRFLAEVEQARQRGWALDAGDYASGIGTVSVPVLFPFGSSEHACSATTFLDQFDEAKVRTMVAGLMSVATLV